MVQGDAPSVFGTVEYIVDAQIPGSSTNGANILVLNRLHGGGSGERDDGDGLLEHPGVAGSVGWRRQGLRAEGGCAWL